MKRRILAVALALALPMSATAGQCSNDITKVDGALAAAPTVSAEDMEMINLRRSEAVDFDRQGRELECIVAIGDAMALLGLAEAD